MYKDRKVLYQQIEIDRKTKVIAYATGDRIGMETQIAPDIIDVFLNHLDRIGNVEKISLILYTCGGNTLAAWNLVNLLREFCKTLEIIVPNKCRSAGTLICLGADNIIMTKQATLGPIDPSLITPLSPIIPMSSPPQRINVSVESVKGYFNLFKKETESSDKKLLSEAYLKLVDHINPLVLGDIHRSQNQILMLAEKLLKMHGTCKKFCFKFPQINSILNTETTSYV